VGWKAKAARIYEERVVENALARLARRLELNRLPFSKDELHTLARRSRESFRNPAKKKDPLEKYKARLSSVHGVEAVRTVSSALDDINNDIGQEEK
jgi:hypothetical protein